MGRAVGAVRGGHVRAGAMAVHVIRWNLWSDVHTSTPRRTPASELSIEVLSPFHRPSGAGLTDLSLHAHTNLVVDKTGVNLSGLCDLR